MLKKVDFVESKVPGATNYGPEESENAVLSK